MLEYIFVGLGVSAAWGIGIYAVMYVNKAHAAVRELEARMHARFVALETLVNTKPEVTSAASHVADWLRAIETLEPGSPKHEAYTARLASLGVKRDA